MVPPGVVPFLAMSISSQIACGRRETMLMVMISDTPLPMPRSVICSPSQVNTMVVAVSTSIVITTNSLTLTTYSLDSGVPRPIFSGLTMASATIAPWIRQTRMVR